MLKYSAPNPQPNKGNFTSSRTSQPPFATTVRYNGEMKRYTMTGVVTNMPSSRYTGQKGGRAGREDRDEMQNQIEKNGEYIVLRSTCPVHVLQYSTKS